MRETSCEILIKLNGVTSGSTTNQFSRRRLSLKYSEYFAQEVLCEKCQSFLIQFMIACENEWKETLINSLFMVGMLIGAFTVGNLGDM